MRPHSSFIRATQASDVDDHQRRPAACGPVFCHSARSCRPDIVLRSMPPVRRTVARGQSSGVLGHDIGAMRHVPTPRLMFATSRDCRPTQPEADAEHCGAARRAGQGHVQEV
eukprot:363609-Chlamydomonas_euryale.AAC.6